MKIALINENSQAAKNALICDTLKSVVEPLGHEVFNYGMYSAEDKEQLTYVQIGILRRLRPCNHRLRNGRGRNACLQLIPGSSLRPRG